MSDISKDGKVTVEQDQNAAKSGRGGEGVVDNAPISYFAEVQNTPSQRNKNKENKTEKIVVESEMKVQDEPIEDDKIEAWKVVGNGEEKKRDAVECAEERVDSLVQDISNRLSIEVPESPPKSPEAAYLGAQLTVKARGGGGGVEGDKTEIREEKVGYISTSRSSTEPTLSEEDATLAKGASSGDSSPPVSSGHLLGANSKPWFPLQPRAKAPSRDVKVCDIIPPPGNIASSYPVVEVPQGAVLPTGVGPVGVLERGTAPPPGIPGEGGASLLYPAPTSTPPSYVPDPPYPGGGVSGGGVSGGGVLPRGDVGDYSARQSHSSTPPPPPPLDREERYYQHQETETAPPHHGPYPSQLMQPSLASGSFGPAQSPAPGRQYLLYDDSGAPMQHRPPQQTQQQGLYALQGYSPPYYDDSLARRPSHPLPRDSGSGVGFPGGSYGLSPGTPPAYPPMSSPEGFSLPGTASGSGLLPHAQPTDTAHGVMTAPSDAYLDHHHQQQQQQQQSYALGVGRATMSVLPPMSHSAPHQQHQQQHQQHQQHQQQVLPPYSRYTCAPPQSPSTAAEHTPQHYATTTATPYSSQAAQSPQQSPLSTDQCDSGRGQGGADPQSYLYPQHQVLQQQLKEEPSPPTPVSQLSPHRISSPSQRKVPSPTRHVESGSVSANGMIYRVRFKRASRAFLLHASAPRNISEGDFVRVEADRGEDLGIVEAIVPAEAWREPTPTAGYRGRGYSSNAGERKWLYRLATAMERLQISDKLQDEQQAVAVIREKIEERDLPMTVLDAEYQFDRHKLVFYFEASHRIDFRELVSDLFSLYKTRIWMSQVDTCFVDEDDDGAQLARRAGLLGRTAEPPSSSEINHHQQQQQQQQLPSPATPVKQRSRAPSAASSVSSLGTADRGDTGTSTQYGVHSRHPQPPSPVAQLSSGTGAAAYAHTYASLDLAAPSQGALGSSHGLSTPPHPHQPQQYHGQPPGSPAYMSGGRHLVMSMPSLTPMNRVRDNTPLSVGWEPSISGDYMRAQTTSLGAVGTTVNVREEEEYNGQPPFVFTTGDDEEEGEISG